MSDDMATIEVTISHMPGSVARGRDYTPARFLRSTWASVATETLTMASPYWRLYNKVQ